MSQLQPRNKPTLSWGHGKEKGKDPLTWAGASYHSPTDPGLRQHRGSSVWQRFRHLHGTALNFMAELHLLSHHVKQAQTGASFLHLPEATMDMLLESME